MTRVSRKSSKHYPVTSGDDRHLLSLVISSSAKMLPVRPDAPCTIVSFSRRLNECSMLDAEKLHPSW